MERTAVKSRDIAIVGYDEGTQTLEVAFRSGGVYHYANVPPTEYQNLMGASSCGTYFKKNIRDKYSSTRIN